MNKYIGNSSQLYGVEEHRLIGGKGDGMRLFQVRNGKGLEFTISADRCADISRLSYRGNNFGYFSACGYVSPAHYDNKGASFLKSFTAGFFTTCGLTAVGSPCTDDGEELPLHGTISNTPAESVNINVDDSIRITAKVRDASMFGHKILLTREYNCHLDDNLIEMTDTIENIGSEETPFMMLYHCNMAYPLLDEDTKVHIDYESVSPRNERAAQGSGKELIMEKPQHGFEEQCYYYKMKNGIAGVYSDKLHAGVSIEFDTKELPCLTQWKMMGEQDYVLGLEPGNCTPDGRDVMRAEKKLKFLRSGEKAVHHLKFRIHDTDF